MFWYFFLNSQNSGSSIKLKDLPLPKVKLESISGQLLLPALKPPENHKKGLTIWSIAWEYSLKSLDHRCHTSHRIPKYYIYISTNPLLKQFNNPCEADSYHPLSSQDNKRLLSIHQRCPKILSSLYWVKTLLKSTWKLYVGVVIDEVMLHTTGYQESWVVWGL